jgi:hypothetical protein
MQNHPERGVRSTAIHPAHRRGDRHQKRVAPAAIGCMHKAARAALA